MAMESGGGGGGLAIRRQKANVANIAVGSNRSSTLMRLTRPLLGIARFLNES
jgi:hypothetical protein